MESKRESLLDKIEEYEGNMRMLKSYHDRVDRILKNNSFHYDKLVKGEQEVARMQDKILKLLTLQNVKELEVNLLHSELKIDDLSAKADAEMRDLIRRGVIGKPKTEEA